MQARLPDGSIIISGYLGKDAEYRQVGDKNSSLTKFSVMVGKRDNGDGIWVNCRCWHSVARATKGLKKYDVALCIGKLEQNTYTDKNGQPQVDKHIVCEGVFVQPPAVQDVPYQPSQAQQQLNMEGTPF